MRCLVFVDDVVVDVDVGDDGDDGVAWCGRVERLSAFPLLFIFGAFIYKKFHTGLNHIDSCI
jgi:hypothetical protein